MRISTRLTLVAALSVAAMLPAGSALAHTGEGARAHAVRTSFSVFPSRVLQGKSATIAVSTRAGSHCTLSVRYADGGRQSDLPSLYAPTGRVAWTWMVPVAAM